jgi:hypothetical protein
MPITIEVLQKTPILISLDNIAEIPKPEPNITDDSSTPSDAEIKTRLQTLVNDTYSQENIRLIAWSAKGKCWYIWTKD